MPASEPDPQAAPQSDTPSDTSPAEQPHSEPASGSTAAGPQAVILPSFDGVQPPPQMPAELDLLADVNLQVKIELGRTRMLVEDVLRLREGGVVELEKLAGDPVDIYVNDRPVARGEVLVLNDNFCVRISEILDVERTGGKRTA
jgi:flagellar motor switch protein FliN